MTLRVVRDAGVRVANSVASVEEALIEGAALTVLVVFLFLNSWRSTVITGLALPVSVLASFVAVWAFGFTLNTMSLLGLSLAIGILIDDAIVVRENIVRHVEMGKDHYQAAFDGTDEIGLAVTATTLSIVVVFVPIAFMGGIAGQWFKPFGLTIVCSVLVSLFVSFSLDPMLSAYWPDPHMPLEQRPLLSRLLGRFNLWFDRRAEGYKGVIAWALDHRLAMVGAGGGGVRGRAGAAGDRPGRLAVRARDRRVGVPASTLETPPGSNLAYTKLQGAGGRRASSASGPRCRYTYSVGRRPGRSGGRGHGVRQAGAEDRADAQAGRGRRRHPRGAVAAGRRRRVDHHRLRDPGEKQIQLQLQGPDAGELARLAESMLARGRTGARRRRRRAVDEGAEAGAGRAARSRAGRVARRDRRPGGAGAAAGVRRHRRRRLDRSVGRDARRHDPAGAGIAQRRSRTSSRCRWSVGGPQGPSTTMPLGQVARVVRRSGRRASITSIASA